MHRAGIVAVLVLLFLPWPPSRPAAEQDAEPPSVVRPIEPPAIGLPAEFASVGIRKFAFIAYGDTRGPADGIVVQPQHSAVVDAILPAIATERAAGFPVRFILQ